MAMSKTIRLAPRNGTSYAAGQHLHKVGPLTERELFAAVPFGGQNVVAADVLQRALTSGWLVVSADGKIDVSSFARAHYDEVAGESAPIISRSLQPGMKTVWPLSAPPVAPKVLPTSP